MLLNRIMHVYKQFPRCGMFSQKSFDSLGLHDSLKQSLKKLGIQKMTNIQNLSFEAISEGNHAFLQAETGSGKTFAYAIPIMNNQILSEKVLSSIILAPSKEYCLQIYKQLKLLNNSLRIQRTGELRQTAQQENVVNIVNLENVDILISTPTQLEQILEKQKEKSHVEISTLVIDEFDIQMNDRNLAEAIKKLLLQYKKNTQKIFSCASTPKKVYDQHLDQYLAKFYPKMEIFKTDDYLQIPKKLSHEVIELKQNEDEFQLLFEVVTRNPTDLFCMIFVSSADRVQLLTDFLNEKKLKARGFYAQLKDEARAEIIESFHEKKFKQQIFTIYFKSILVCTDSLSRGFDFLDVNHVIEFDFAGNAISFLHRAGRTARAGKNGKRRISICKIKQNSYFYYKKI